MPLLPITVSFSLAAIALLHVHWGLGGHWPRRDAASLTALVVGKRGPMPSPTACHAVAAALIVAALLVLTAAGTLRLPIPARLATVGAWGVVAVLALRGVGGFFESRMRPEVRELPYHFWNVRVYSPLCLALALLAALSIS